MPHRHWVANKLEIPRDKDDTLGILAHLGNIKKQVVYYESMGNIVGIRLYKTKSRNIYDKFTF
jgi:hypothetical protein